MWVIFQLRRYCKWQHWATWLNLGHDSTVWPPVRSRYGYGFIKFQYFGLVENHSYLLFCRFRKPCQYKERCRAGWTQATVYLANISQWMRLSRWIYHELSRLCQWRSIHRSGSGLNNISENMYLIKHFQSIPANFPVCVLLQWFSQVCTIIQCRRYLQSRLCGALELVNIKINEI